jgi:hypothetical protein
MKGSGGQGSSHSGDHTLLSVLDGATAILYKHSTSGPGAPDLLDSGPAPNQRDMGGFGVAGGQPEAIKTTRRRATCSNRSRWVVGAPGGE